MNCAACGSTNLDIFSGISKTGPFVGRPWTKYTCLGCRHSDFIKSKKQPAKPVPPIVASNVPRETIHVEHDPEHQPVSLGKMHETAQIINLLKEINQKLGSIWATINLSNDPLEQEHKRNEAPF